MPGKRSQQPALSTRLGAAAVAALAAWALTFVGCEQGKATDGRAKAKTLPEERVSGSKGARLSADPPLNNAPSLNLPRTSSKRRRPHAEGRAKDSKKSSKKKLSAYARAMIAGDSALYSGLFDQARREFLKAMEARPYKMAPALGALRAMRERGRGEERAGVIRTIDKKIDQLAGAPETAGAAHLLSARMAIALGQPGKAMDAATMAVELLPELGVAWRVRGEAAMVAEDWRIAVQSFRKAAKLGLEAKAGTWERMADALDELGKLEAAESAGRKAVALTGSDPNARRKRLNLLAVILKRRGALKEARTTVDKALELGTDDPMVLHNAASIAEASGETKRALALYGKALKHASLPMTHWRRGRLLLLNDKPNDALTHFRQAAANPEKWTWPPSTAFWPAFDTAKLYARAGRHKTALGWFDDAARLALRPEDQREIRSWVRYTLAERRRSMKKGVP